MNTHMRVHRKGGFGHQFQPYLAAMHAYVRESSQNVVSCPLQVTFAAKNKFPVLGVFLIFGRRVKNLFWARLSYSCFWLGACPTKKNVAAFGFPVFDLLSSLFGSSQKWLSSPLFSFPLLGRLFVIFSLPPP